MTVPDVPAPVYHWGADSSEHKQWSDVGRESAWLALRYLEHAVEAAEAEVGPEIKIGWNNMGIHLREIAGTGAWWAAAAAASNVETHLQPWGGAPPMMAPPQPPAPPDYGEEVTLLFYLYTLDLPPGSYNEGPSPDSHYGARWVGASWESMQNKLQQLVAHADIRMLRTQPLWKR